MAPTRSLQRAAGRPTRASKKVLLDRLPGTDARRDGSSLPAAQHALEQLDVLAEVPGAEEQVAYACLRRCADALRAVGVLQEPADALAEASQVAGVHEEAGAAVLDLLPDAADRRGDDRAALPHRLCHGEAEALRETLLRDDVGAPLQRVDDHGVLVDIRHRQQGEMHATSDPSRQL